MNTVMTPAALAKSKFKRCLLSELRSVDADEVFLFIYPSPDALNKVNGDGDLLEIHDFARDLRSVTTSRGTHSTEPHTTVYYR